MTAIEDFATAVRGFCDWAQSSAPATTKKSEMLIARLHLSRLYAMAVELPQCESEWTDSTLSLEEWKVVFQRFGQLPVGYYGSVYDPLEVLAGEASLGDLADDLADTWRDLKEGLMLFDAGDLLSAGSKWQESFTIHWGYHAAKALAVVQFWLGQNMYKD